MSSIRQLWSASENVATKDDPDSEEAAAPTNCWEHTNCGREPGGANEALLGACPAATDEHYSGKNRGLNGGRVCWRVAGTLCLGSVQGTQVAELMACSFCGFYHLVRQQEGDDIQL